MTEIRTIHDAEVARLERRYHKLSARADDVKTMLDDAKARRDQHIAKRAKRAEHRTAKEAA